MARVKYRGVAQWQATVRKVGFPTQTKTFESKGDAEDWAKITEGDMRRDFFVDKSALRLMTFRQLLEKYRDEVTPKKKGAVPELSRLKRLIAHPISLLIPVEN